jgi:hypothetical protein
MKTWLLFAIVAMLLLFSFREGMTQQKPKQQKAGQIPLSNAPEPEIPTNLPPQIQKAQTITPAPYVTGNSTGGTSTSSMGPNSGGTTNLGSKKVWGPEFTGLGMSMAGADQGDTTKSRSYPLLIGPKGSESTRIDGLGIIPPSKNYELANNGSLPTPESTGSAEGSQFLPNSRTPGDQDLIPDPYRVASAFSTSTYSSKTEPVPFLTDFSAFQK